LAPVLARHGNARGIHDMSLEQSSRVAKENASQSQMLHRAIRSDDVVVATRRPRFLFVALHRKRANGYDGVGLSAGSALIRRVAS
jgi:hypothetical protein